MRLSLLLLVFCTLNSCSLKETIGKVQAINADLKETFNHEEIVTSINVGTESDDSQVTVTFYNYDMNNKTFKEMEDFAAQVRQRVVLKNPEFKNLNNIQIRLTKEKGTDDPDNFIVFKHKDGE